MEKATLINEYNINGDWKRYAISFLIDCAGSIAFPYLQSAEFADRKVFGFLKKGLIRVLSRDEVSEIITRFGVGCDFDLRGV